MVETLTSRETGPIIPSLAAGLLWIWVAHRHFTHVLCGMEIMNDESRHRPKPAGKKSRAPAWSWAFVLTYALTVIGFIIYGGPGILTWFSLLTVGAIALVLMWHKAN